MGRYGTLVGALDQGTSSTRFLIFAANSAELVTYHQMEIKHITPQPGWVEEDPMEILRSVHICIDKAIENLKSMEVDPSDIKCIGITNQRETTIAWDRHTGKPLHNAIVWLDTRVSTTVEKVINSADKNYKDTLREYSGLPVATYFSANKLRWLLDECPDVAEAARDNRLAASTVDTWLLWNLTGAQNGGVYATDVTNASRTMLMNIRTLKWDEHLCRFYDIPINLLPDIRSSSEIFGHVTTGPLSGVPISAILGDQQAALVGQYCFNSGEAKNTYGTGCFLLYNTGEKVVHSEHGLLTTVAYQFGKSKPHYALEGSIAIAGVAVRWLRDNLQFMKSAGDSEILAREVTSSGGCYFVPAFSGLFCPHWESDARGIICGLTLNTDKRHITRAALEAVAFQTRDVLEAMKKDSGLTMKSLKVDGGMTQNNLLMQLQADIAGKPVVRPTMTETTALGVAMAAGAAEGINLWSLKPEDLQTITSDTFLPKISKEDRDVSYADWLRAVDRAKHWCTSSSTTK